MSNLIIPDLSTTISLVYSDEVTVGSGKTGQSIPIEIQVSLDWVKYALQRNCWKLLYSEEKINADSSGIDKFTQRVKNVLDVAVNENIFSTYKITGATIDRPSNKISIKFTANLIYSILGVNEVQGVVYH